MGLLGRVPGSARTGLGLGLVQVGVEPGQLPEEQIPEGREEQACAKVPSWGRELESAGRAVLSQTSLHPLFLR